jgi:predicted RecA/RadA family phage recombinase
MAKNRVFENGKNLTLPVIAGTVSGSPVIVGMIPGVALSARDSNGNASVCTEGVFLVSVTGALTTTGLPVYIVSSTGALVVAPGAGIQLYGHSLDTKGAGAGNVRVRIAHHALTSGQPA